VVLVDIDWVNDTDFEFGAGAVIARHKRRKDASPDVKVARARNVEVGCFWTLDPRADPAVHHAVKVTRFL